MIHLITLKFEVLYVRLHFHYTEMFEYGMLLLLNCMAGSYH